MAEYLVNGYAYPSISEETLAWWLPAADVAVGVQLRFYGGGGSGESCGRESGDGGQRCRGAADDGADTAGCGRQI